MLVLSSFPVIHSSASHCRPPLGSRAIGEVYVCVWPGSSTLLMGSSETTANFVFGGLYSCCKVSPNWVWLIHSYNANTWRLRQEGLTFEGNLARLVLQTITVSYSQASDTSWTHLGTQKYRFLNSPQVISPSLGANLLLPWFLHFSQDGCTRTNLRGYGSSCCINNERFRVSWGPWCCSRRYMSGVT